MKNHAQRAQGLFDCGYNCAQSVLGAFCDELGLDFETAMKLTYSFGGGVGGLHEICGAVSGMAAAAGQALGKDDPSDKDAKAQHYVLIQRMAKKFKDEHSSLICRELLAGLGENPALEDRHRVCSVFVGCAAEILEDELRSLEKDKA